MIYNLHIDIVFRTNFLRLQRQMFENIMTCYFDDCPNLLSAENVAKQWEISREQQDEFALQSQLKCEAAQVAGSFNDEIVPVTIKNHAGK